MPEFRVIDGGGDNGEWDRQYAEQLFRDFAVAVARGMGGGELYPTTTKFFQFLEHMQETRLPVGPVIDAAMAELQKEAFEDQTDASPFKYENAEVRRAAWRVTVEHMTHDGLSRARQSKRESALRSAVDRMVLEHEIASRQNGWSYIQYVTKGLPKWPLRKK